MVADADDLTAVTEAFGMVNVRVFLAFEKVQPKKRIVNRIRCGQIAFGATKPPVELYKGPTGRRALMGTKSATVAGSSGGKKTLPGPT